MKIFLLGLPGSGKTKLGKELSIALQLPFVDLDLAIEGVAGKKITDIFKEPGEGYFRELESEELKKWCSSTSGLVMATGGGTPCFLDNMELINQSGKSIFLDVPASVIAKRITKAGLSKRPLLSALQANELKDQIEFLRSSRILFYKKAHITITGEEITSASIVEKINS